MLILALGLLAVLAGVAVLVMRRPGPVKDEDKDEKNLPESDVFTMAEYRARGGPGPETWKPGDHHTALGVLQDLNRGDKHKLPREQDPESKALFARLVADENLKEARAVADGGQGPEAVDHLRHVTGPLFHLYLAAAQADARFNPELVRVAEFALKVEITAADLARTYFDRLPADQKEDLGRLNGLEQLRKSIVWTAADLLRLLKEGKLNPTERQRLAGFLAEKGDAVAAHLARDQREHLAQQFGLGAKQEMDDTVKQSLDRARRRLEGEKP
jgi:hypothetical protein